MNYDAIRWARVAARPNTPAEERAATLACARQAATQPDPYADFAVLKQLSASTRRPPHDRRPGT